jgi:hypothetical protein
MKTQRQPVMGLLTEAEAAERFGRPVEELHALIAAGSLTSVKVSTRNGQRFWREEIGALVAGRPDDRAAGSVTAPVRAGTPQAWPDQPTPPVEPGERSVSAEDAPTRITARNAGSDPDGRTRTDARAQRPAFDRPQWPPYVFAPERPRPTYLAFVDQAHVGSYLELRKQLSARSEERPAALARR